MAKPKQSAAERKKQGEQQRKIKAQALARVLCTDFPSAAAIVDQLPYKQAREMAVNLIWLGRAVGVKEYDFNLTRLKMICGWSREAKLEELTEEEEE